MKKISKEIIVKTAMKIILQKNGSSGLTIRDIAKKLECSHPNIYNYYSSVDELYWDCIIYALNDMQLNVLKKIPLTATNDEKFLWFFAYLLQYSIDHVGWYRLIWFDPIGIPIPDKAIPYVTAPGIKLRDFLLELYPEIKIPDKAEQIARIIHRYFHGELASYITSRVHLETDLVFKLKILKNCFYLMQSFLKYDFTDELSIETMINQIIIRR